MESRITGSQYLLLKVISKSSAIHSGRSWNWKLWWNRHFWQWNSQLCTLCHLDGLGLPPRRGHWHFVLACQRRLLNNIDKTLFLGLIKIKINLYWW